MATDNSVLVEKICRLICQRQQADPDTVVSSRIPQIQPFAYSLYYVVPQGPDDIQPLWTIYKKEVAMVLDILQSGEFILPVKPYKAPEYPGQGQAAQQGPPSNPQNQGVIVAQVSQQGGPSKAVLTSVAARLGIKIP